MKYGTFIGIDRKNRLVKGANHDPMILESYMELVGIKDPRDVIGPFETIISERTGKRLEDTEATHSKVLNEARQHQKRLAEWLKKNR